MNKGDKVYANNKWQDGQVKWNGLYNGKEGVISQVVVKNDIYKVTFPDGNTFEFYKEEIDRA